MLIDRKWDSFSVKVLIDSLRSLARKFGIYMAELEVYRKIRAPIFFPSSNSAVDNCNDPLINPILIQEGLKLAEVGRTFQIKKNLNLTSIEMPNKLEIRPIRINSSQDRQTYYRLWAESGLMPVSLSKKQMANWISFRPWYGDVCPLLDIEENIFFAEMKGIPIAFVHWWPNMYKILSQNGRDYIYSSKFLFVLIA